MEDLVILTLDEIRSWPRERVEEEALALAISPVGRTLERVRQLVYEVANGLLPSEEPPEDAEADPFVRAAESMAPDPDVVPEITATEDQQRERMFLLVNEALGDRLASMTEAEITKVLHWCPVVNGEAVDCWACPRSVLLRCYRRHRAHVEGL